jgi:hypothetical protein
MERKELREAVSAFCDPSSRPELLRRQRRTGLLDARARMRRSPTVFTDSPLRDPRRDRIFFTG